MYQETARVLVLPALLERFLSPLKLLNEKKKKKNLFFGYSIRDGEMSTINNVQRVNRNCWRSMFVLWN